MIPHQNDVPAAGESLPSTKVTTTEFPVTSNQLSYPEASASVVELHHQSQDTSPIELNHQSQAASFVELHHPAEVTSSGELHRPADEDTIYLTPKRRKIEQQEWKQNKRKELRQKGLPYISKRGKEISARQLKLPCSCMVMSTKCRELTNEDREATFAYLWTLTDDAKRAFINGLINHIPVKRRRVSVDVPNRFWTLEYNLKQISGETRPVCKKFFLNSTGLTNWFIQS